jgi:hypothetical protein
MPRMMTTSGLRDGSLIVPLPEWGGTGATPRGHGNDARGHDNGVTGAAPSRFSAREDEAGRTAEPTPEGLSARRNDFA